jgi:hypothetical protein
MKPLDVTTGETPTLEEAMDRLAGRRATNIEDDARYRVVTPTVGQCRKTRRNNLRIARQEARAAKRAAAIEAGTAVLIAAGAIDES